MDKIYLILIIIMAALGIGIGIIIAILNKKFRELEEAKTKDQSWQLLNQNIQGMQQRIDHTTRAINERLDNAARVVGAVGKELGQMQQIGTQLASVQEFLRSPKLRGNLGEQGLQEILKQCLPPDFIKSQHQFRTGDKVDAAIKIEAGLIPIDAKFPLENFNQYLKASEEKSKLDYIRKFRADFRTHINAIKKKYILADEGTTDFAFMYLPSENVYYEILNNAKFNDLFDYAVREKIMLASPSTLVYYLRTIMLGLEGKRVHEMSRQILATLKIIQQENQKFGSNLGVLNKHVSNAKNTMDTVNSDYSRLSNKIDNINQLETQREEEEKLLADSLDKRN